MELLPYDPEVYQFGGEEGLDAAHEFFTIESAAVLEYHRLVVGAEARLEPEIFSLLLLDSLLGQVTDDAFELWDTWCKMELTGRRFQPDANERDRLRDSLDAACTTLRPLLAEPVRVAEAASQAERDLLQRYRSRLPPVINHLRCLAATGTLLWGLREILPFWVIFHWNRMRFLFEDRSG